MQVNCAAEICIEFQKKISYGKLIRKSHSGPLKAYNSATKTHTKNVQHKALSQKRVRQEKAQSSFTGNTRNEGGSTLIKIPWPAMKANSNFMHNQLLPPLLNASSQHIPHGSSPPPPTPHLFLPNSFSLMHAFASSPRHQDYFETTVFGTRPKRR